MPPEAARRVREGPTSGRPSAEESARTRETILRVALEEFANRGYDGVSIRDLNRRIGGSHNLIHHHFGAKHELWRAAVDYGYGRSRAAIPMPEPGADSPEALAETLARALRRMVESSAEDPTVHKIFEHEAGLGGERLAYILERHWLPAVAEASPFFERLIRASERDIDARSLLLLVHSGVTSVFRLAPMSRRFGGPDPFSPEGIERHARTVIEVLMHGLIGRR